MWIDPEMCKRSKEVIPGLIRRINQLEFEIERIKIMNDGMSEITDEGPSGSNKFGKFRLFGVLVVIGLIVSWFYSV